MIDLNTLKLFYNGICSENEPLSRRSTIRIGGPADLFCQPQNEQELMQLFRCAVEEQVPLVSVGRGSNILFSDAGFRGIVIHPGSRLGELQLTESDLLEVGCRADNATVIRFCADNELSGLEYLNGVPGTFGGAVAMNAGAYEQEVGNLVERVRLVDADGIVDVDARELKFSYRRTEGLKNRFIARIWLRLQHRPSQDIYTTMQRIMEKRRKSQPLELPSLGSVFKRTGGHFPGKLIEEAGCMGLRIGAMEVSTLHANFIVNRGSGTAADMLALIEQVEKRVREHSGVELPLEIKLVGFAV